MVNNELRPTVWRTARALANANRLRLLREVWKSRGRLSVTELAERLGMAVSTTSQYLRALNARGLISVGRSGSYVYYADGKDRSLPEAQAIQDAFSSLFSQRRLSDGWGKPLLAVLRAYLFKNRRVEDVVVPFGERRPRLTRDSVFGHKRVRRPLLTPHVRLDLIERGLNFVAREQVGEPFVPKGRHADRANDAFFVQFLHSAPRAVIVAVRLVRQVQVDVVEP